MTVTIPRLELETTTWVRVRDGNRAAFVLFSRHYSHRKKTGDRRHRFVGPGERIVLITQDGQALFVWRKFIDDSGQLGINCAIFRNESHHLSSDLITEAEQIAWDKWPGQRLYTYVDAQKIRSTNPGFCFKSAGWTPCGNTKKRNLLILEKLPPCQS